MEAVRHYVLSREHADVPRIILQVCWIPIFKGKKLILAGDPLQLPPTILSIDKHNKKQNIKVGASVAQASSSTKDKTKQSKPNSKPKTAQLSTGLTGLAIESPVLGDSDSENSSDSDQILDGDEPALVTPSNPSLNTKTQTRTKGTGTGLRPPRTLETTLFDRLEKMYGARIKRMLKVQYR
jgi:DNA polymerase alpha-associated DNA helicase A